MPPSSSNEAKALANEMYTEMGLSHGALLYRAGLAGFVVAALVGWVIFYAQLCNSAGNVVVFSSSFLISVMCSVT